MLSKSRNTGLHRLKGLDILTAERHIIISMVSGGLSTSKSKDNEYVSTLFIDCRLCNGPGLGDRRRQHGQTKITPSHPVNLGHGGSGVPLELHDHLLGYFLERFENSLSLSCRPLKEGDSLWV